MKRKISMLVVFMFMVLTLFTGCSLFTLNQEKYLNEVVVSVGDIEITKQQLLNTYNSYAEELQNQGKTNDQIVNYCIDLLVDREILIAHAKDKFTLTQKEKNDALVATYDFLVEQLSEYEGEVRAEKNITSSTSTSTETESAVVYNPYSPIIKWEDGQIKAVKDNDANVSAHYGFSDYVAGFKTYWVPENEEVAEIAYSRYLRDLKSYEEYKKLSKDNDDVLRREIERVYDIQCNNAYLTRLQSEYEDLMVNQITPEDIYAEYNRLVNENKARYDIPELGMDAYVDDMLNKAEDVYYHAANKEFFYVTHVLLKFSDEQQAQIDEMKAILEDDGITQADFDVYLSNMASQIEVNGKSAEDILFEITEAVNSEETIEGKAKAFNEFIYTYNSDPGIQNAVKDYVIGIEIEEEEESRSKMVESFTKESRQLAKNYDKYVEGQGELDLLSGLVESDYGYHIILFTGYAENMEVSANVVEAMEDLNSYTVNAHTEETYLQHIYDSLYAALNTYETYQESILNSYKAEHQVKKYPSRYKEFNA